MNERNTGVIRVDIRSWISQIGDLDLVPVFVKVSLITVNYVLGFTSAGRWLDGRAGEAGRGGFRRRSVPSA